MKRIFSIVSLIVCMMMTVACASSTNSVGNGTGAGSAPVSEQKDFQMKTKILFINGSENRDGHTSQMAKQLFGNTPYDQLNLVDYRVDSLGQKFEGDQFDVVLKAMQNADAIVFGTPVYWHTMSGSMKNVMDRLYDYGSNIGLQGKDFYFITQGAAPTPESIQQLKWTMNRFGQYYKMNVKGMASTPSEVDELKSLIQK